MEYTPDELFALRHSPLVIDVAVPAWVTKQGMEAARFTRPEPRQHADRAVGPTTGSRVRDRRGDRDRDHAHGATDEWETPGRTGASASSAQHHAPSGFPRSRPPQHGSNVKAFDEDFAAVATGGRPPTRSSRPASSRDHEFNGEDDPRGKTVDDFERFRQQMKQQQKRQEPEKSSPPLKDDQAPSSRLAALQIDEPKSNTTSVSAPPGFNIQPSSNRSGGVSGAGGKPAGTSKFSKFFTGGPGSDSQPAEPVKNKEDAEGFERILAMLSAQGEPPKQHQQQQQQQQSQPPSGHPTGPPSQHDNSLLGRHTQNSDFFMSLLSNPQAPPPNAGPYGMYGSYGPPPGQQPPPPMHRGPAPHLQQQQQQRFPGPYYDSQDPQHGPAHRPGPPAGFPPGMMSPPRHGLVHPMQPPPPPHLQQQHQPPHQHGPPQQQQQQQRPPGYGPPSQYELDPRIRPQQYYGS